MFICRATQVGESSPHPFSSTSFRVAICSSALLSVFAKLWSCETDRVFEDMPLLTRRQLKRVLAVTQDKIDEDWSRSRRALRASRMSRIELGAELVRMWEGIVEAQDTGDRVQSQLREENQKLRDELRAAWAAHYNLQEEVFRMGRELRELRAQMPPAREDDLFADR
jgi:hypothetical protein